MEKLFGALNARLNFLFGHMGLFLDRAKPLKFTLFEDRLRLEDRAEPLKNFE
jgi:hypothetical protein